MSLSSPDMSELIDHEERDLDAERKRRQRARERQVKCRLQSKLLDSSFCIACGFQHGLQRQCVCVRCHTSHPDSDCPTSDFTSQVGYRLPAGTSRGKLMLHLIFLALQFPITVIVRSGTVNNCCRLLSCMWLKTRSPDVVCVCKMSFLAS
jgi:hypothetical protein